MISVKKLREFWTNYPQTEVPLRSWYTVVNNSDWKHFPDLKQSFPSADIVGRRTVFDILGNRFRLIARVNYQTKLVFVLSVLTHAQYDLKKWMK